MTRRYDIETRRTVPELYSVAGLVILLLAANCHALALDFLIHDDSAHYYFTLLDRFDWRAGQIGRYYFLVPIVDWPMYSMMASAGPVWTRTMMFLFYGVLGSVFLYAALRNFGLARVLSLFIASLPFLYPQQLRIPAGLNISYTSVTFFFCAVSLLMLSQLSATSGRRIHVALRMLALFASFFGLAFYALDGAFALLGLGLLVAVLMAAKSFAWRTGISVLAGWGIFLAFSVNSLLLRNADAPHKSTEFAWDLLGARLHDYFAEDFLPIASVDPMTSIVVSTLLVLAALLFVVRLGLTSAPRNDSRIGLLTICAVIWMVATVLPYIIFAERLSGSRYFWLGSFGAASLIGSSLFAITRLSFFSRWRLFPAILACILLFAGVQKFLDSREQRERQERITSNLRHNFREFAFPERSQLVYVTRLEPPHPGVSPANTGLLWYAGASRNVYYSLVFSERREKFWYDPFKQERQGWRNPPMSRLRATDPLFAFKGEGARITRIEYLLQAESTEPESPWHLYALAEDGSVSELASGTGREEYRSYVEAETDIAFDDILFGKPE